MPKRSDVFENPPLSDAEFLQRVREGIPPRKGIVPVYPKIPYEEKLIKGWGRDTPPLDEYPAWGMEMWKGLPKEPNAGGDNW